MDQGIIVEVEPDDTDCSAKFGNFQCQYHKDHVTEIGHATSIVHEWTEIVPDPDHPGDRKVIVKSRRGLLTWRNDD